jgi:hypothetical protein
MLRNLIISVIGAILGFVLVFGGSYAAWVFFVGSGPSTNKAGLERFMVMQAFVIIPAAAIITAVFVASLVSRSYWWLGGVSLLPLFVYGYIRGEARAEVVLSILYLLLATGAAFIVSRFKRTRPA